MDIEKGAVDIARLRFWLAIIVDEEEPLPLPNLDYKIMQGNSLLENFEGIDLSHMLEKPERGMLDYTEELRTLLKTNIDEYFGDNSHEDKRKKNDVIKSCVFDLVCATCGLKQNSESALALYEKIWNGTSDFFLWHTWFNDVFSRPQKQGGTKSGFDIVIGNPPYVGEGENSSAFYGFKETSPYYIGKMNLWYGFACQGIDLLKENGILSFIATNNWTTTAGGKKLRNKIMNDTKIIQLLDFNSYMIFESANIQTMVMEFQKDSKIDNYTFDYRKLTKPQAKKEDMFAMLNKTLKQVDYFEPKISRQKFMNKNFVFSVGTRDSILEKMAENAEFLNADDATNGIHPHYDFVNNKINRLHPFTTVGAGIFGLSEKEKNSLKLSDSELKLIKPYFTTEQIHRYYTEPKNDFWIIYTTSNFKDPNSMDKYPHLKKHLDYYKDVISSCNKPYGLHRSREEKFFKGEKIISQRKCVGQPSFSYSDFDCYVSATFYVIKTSRFNLKFLTGLFNSKAISFWLKNRGKMQGENFQIDKEPLMAIPIPQATAAQQKPIVTLVDKILAAKKANTNADTSDLEKQIDVLVYKLYDLTGEEIGIIERQKSNEKTCRL
ncbi:MAG: Eco57I restriction-modification methylase domain-containing protein [Treponemataceae bacterium]|nr:Eco57I restriction-modification methylase domain-containing protein [Treponemataceae bacterium]